MVRQHYHGHHIHRLLLDHSHEISITPQTNETKTSSSLYDSNSDTNMVIILAALLCSLICALGLNSIVRCALRCGRRRLEFETPEDTNFAGLASSTGVKKVAVGQITVVVYNAGLKTPATDCPICLGEFVEGEKVRILPKCHHGFHVKCIDTWLVSHSSCPNCRQLLFPEEVRVGI